MLKIIIIVIFVLSCSFYKAQTDSSSAKVIPTEKPSKSKKNEKKPKNTSASKPKTEKVKTEKVKPAKVKTEKVKSTKVKTEKVETEKPKKQKAKNTDSYPVANGFKPKISLGGGMLSFHGDLYDKHFQAPWTGRIGTDVNLSQRLSRSFQLNFNILFGKLGANEWTENRQQNFQSEIRSGGVSLMYDFGNFINDNYRIRPWVSIGINSLEFLSKTDLYDRNNNKYYFWSDGSIKNIDENAVNASSAVNLNRDYSFETDIRELNKDGFGKYQERALSVPVGFGALLKITDRFDLKMGMQYYFTTTDYIDGITGNSIGARAGNNRKDNFVYSSIALQFDLVFVKKSIGDTLGNNYFDDVDFLVIGNEDSDGDGVKDDVDKCHGTPKDVKVDEFGCPFDDDNDRVPNHADDELTTPVGMAVNSRGVSLTDAYWQDWYGRYTDSIHDKAKEQIVENFYATQKDSIKKADTRLYTVELARYIGPVPNDEMAYLLSIGDVKSSVLPDGSTVLYTAGTYKEIQNASKRREEFIKGGNKNTKIGFFRGGDLIELSEEEIVTLSNGKSGAVDNEDDTNEFTDGEIVYRVQLGAFKNRVSKEIFKNVGPVVEIKGDDGLYHYTTKGHKTIQNSANSRANLVVEGYVDAFVTAYKQKKRIALSETKATMQTKEVENIKEIKQFSSIDKSLITFKIQLGTLQKIGGKEMDEKIKEIPDWERQNTETGMVRYMSGSFKDHDKAEKYRLELTSKGFTDAFVIAVFKGEVISIQEAKELLK